MFAALSDFVKFWDVIFRKISKILILILEFTNQERHFEIKGWDLFAFGNFISFRNAHPCIWDDNVKILWMELNWFEIKCLDSICSLAPNSIFASSFLFQNFLFFPNFQFPKTWFFDWHLYQIRILKIIFFLQFLSFLNQMHLF